MKVLAYKVDCKTGTEQFGEVIEIENELKPMQEFVGGYIEVVTMPNGLVVVCDEEGSLKNYPHCADIDIAINGKTACYSFVGNIFICGTDGEEFRGLSETEIEDMRKVVQR